MYMQMTIIIEGVTFEKLIGKSNIYAEQYGLYIPNSEYANTFQEMIITATQWLEKQN